MLSRIWRHLTAPVFNATTKTNGSGAVTVTAGQRTNICTIKLSLAAEGTFANHQEEIDFPRPSIKSIPVAQVGYGEERRPNRYALELDVYVHVTSAGKYSITPEFPEDRYNFRAIDKSPVHFYVEPSELQFIELSSIAPIPGHGKADSVYRGGTVNIRVTARDEFGNFITSAADLNFNISSCTLSVTLLSTVLNTQDKNFLAKLHCYKVGKGSFDLVVSQGNRQVRKDFPLEVIPPPVSAAKSYIIQSDIDEIQERIYEAGQAIALKLKLIDVFGNAIFYEESKSFVESICLALDKTPQVSGGSSKKLVQSSREENSSKMCPNSDVHSNNACQANSVVFTAKGKTTLTSQRHNANLENTTSLKVRPLDVDPNICKVEFTSTIAGNRRVSLFADRKTEEVSTITIRIQPGPLEELQIVKQDPTDFSNVYRGGTAKIWVNAKDEFGNRIVESNLTFAIFSDSSLVKLLSTDCVDNSEQGSHQLTIRWGKVGKGSFDLIVSQGNRQVRKDIPLEVIPPPVSAAKSYIIQSDFDEMQERIHEAGKAIAFKFKLIDIFGNPISSEESVRDQDQFLLHYRKGAYRNSSCAAQYTIENGRSLSVRPVDSNICELEFFPSEPGKTLYFFSVAGKMLNQFRIAVLPREGDHVHLDRETSENFFEVREEIPYYEEDYLELYEYDKKILCLGVRRRDLIGEDYANVNNINRVLEKEYPSCILSKDLVSWKYGLLVVFDLSSFEKAAALKVLKLLSYLVEGQYHYRNEASEFAREREKWDKIEEEAEENLEKNREDFEKDLEELEDDYEEFDRGDEEFEKEAQELEDHYKKLKSDDRIEADKSRRFKLICGRKMHESNEKASGAIFKFYNHNRPQSEIDLHGQRVGNSAKLRELEANLRKENKTPKEIEEIMERERLKRDEAIRKLDERMRTFDHKKAKRDGEDWLEIIDGAGHHSETKGKQKIRPKVKEYLGKKDIKYVEANEGALLITFSEYTGKEPCVADFYCTGCKRKWTSTTSWKGFFQKCFRCDSERTISKCLPFKLRSVPPERRGENRDFTRGDHRRLCQKCIQLGRDCRQQR